MGAAPLAEMPWLNEERLVAYARILCAFYLTAALSWLAMSPNLIDPTGKPIGTDFMNVWAAGKLALAGDAPAAYDYARHQAVQQHALPYAEGQIAAYFGWHYPPMFLFAASLLALFPYGAALALWMAATLPAYLAVVRRIVDHSQAALLTLAFPAAFVNLAHGQNGFLTTALLGGGLLALEKRPLLAGALFGLLAYKPQFGMLIPLALAVGMHWRAIASAAATALATAGLSALVFGVDTWTAFRESMTLTRGFILEQGATGWEKIQSTFSAVRMLGGGVDLAYAAQGAVAIAVAAAVIYVWRKPVSMTVKGATLVTASVMATPYVLDYDLIVLALPIAWLAAEARKTAFLPWEKATLFAAFVLPIVSREIGALHIPVAPLVLASLLAFAVRRAMPAPQSA